ncbi:hypothetical protein J7337_006072 [Fusarium musae]|uniref:Uncharacterized protein n=1 Tax=Fusarium musae TaxID=1042133 RepID=A0A9P8DJG7_9HYPO|nr:hypothetical protein J7337_006072 [Fusarium musae]KAG9503229.1 hypothetical protein J7337_006072 [Fusarium musae]
MSSLAVALELRARMRKPSVQQPWKAHVPTVSDIEGPVAVGLIDVEVAEDALEVVELLVVEVLELVVVVELARDVVLMDELVAEDVDEGATEVERVVVVADVTLDMDEAPAGPPATRELSDETTERLEDTVADEERLTIEDAANDDIPLRDSALGALNTFVGNVFDDIALESDELEIGEVVLVIVVEARELVEENVAKVVHVVELVLEDVDEDIVADEVAVVEVEVIVREAALALLVLGAEEALIATLVEVKLPVEDADTELEAEEALLRPPAMLPKTLSEVLKELVELVDILLETPAEVELLAEPMLVGALFEVELDPPLEEELPLAEAKDDEKEALEKLDAAPMLVDATEPELETEKAAFEETATEELTPLADEKAPIDVGNELL